MRLFTLLAALFLLVAPSAAQSAQQFDLICHARAVSGPASFPPFEKRYFAPDTETRLRIDLGALRMCVDRCLALYPISRLTGRWIIYAYDVDREGPEHEPGAYREGDSEMVNVYSDRIAIDRRSLRYWRRSYAVSKSVVGIPSFTREIGRCVLVPFSGLRHHDEDER